MEKELKKIISFIFKRSGKYKLYRSDFYLSLSIDLKWFSPEKAKDFIDYAIKQNLLIVNNDILEPNFDINKISIPYGYNPEKILFENHNKTNRKKNIDLNEMIFRKNNYNLNLKKRIIKDIDHISFEKNIYSAVATILVLMDLNIEFNAYIKFAEDQIINE